MMRDTTYCVRGSRGDCPRAPQCLRVYTGPGNDYLWWFGGCPEEDDGQPDYSYFKPKTNNHDETR